jgi:outer membrane immunogenic protein
MKLTTIAVALSIAAGGQALAADVAPPGPPPPPPTFYKSPPAIYDWSGFYIGINAGYGSGYSNWSDGPVGTSGSFPLTGFLVGGTLGANYQIGDYVFGIEADGDWTNLSGNSGLTCGAIAAVVPPPDACQTQSDWLATLRGRLGYAFDRVLLYGTAGAAFGSVQAGLNPPSTFDSGIEAGWTVGAGVEFAISPNWTAKVEYLFVNLPNGACTTVPNCAGAAGSIVSFNENIVRAGVNFKFGPW